MKSRQLYRQSVRVFHTTCKCIGCSIRICLYYNSASSNCSNFVDLYARSFYWHIKGSATPDYIKLRTSLPFNNVTDKILGSSNFVPGPIT